MNACCFGSFPRQQADSLPEVRRPSKTNFENIFANFSEIGGCALRTLPVLYFLADADVAQLVEHDLAKVGVAGSNPVVRSIVANRPVIIKSFDRPFHDGVDEMATWPSGKAEACKAFTPGSNPGVASIRSPCGADGLRIEKRYPCGRGSAGRARPCQGRGRGFEPRRPLHDRTSPSANRRAFFMPRSERRRLEQL